MRPIGVGYYWLGEFTDAKLTVTDCTGSLGVSDATIGIKSEIGIKYSNEKFELFADGGYRWLKFTDVSQQPEGGFVVSPGGPLVQLGNLPETFDYSGFIIKAGVSIKF